MERAILHTGGLDLKYGIRSNLVANLTFNTDFADADVDPVRFNITPFKASLPEKRQFFLENSGISGWLSRYAMFFSRQIGIDPVSGQQVPARCRRQGDRLAGKYDVGILDAKTRASGPNPYANYFVGRVKRRLCPSLTSAASWIDNRERHVQDHFIGRRELTVTSSSLEAFLNGFLVKTFSADRRLRAMIGPARSTRATTAISCKSNFSDHGPTELQSEVGFVDALISSATLSTLAFATP